MKCHEIEKLEMRDNAKKLLTWFLNRMLNEVVELLVITCKELLINRIQIKELGFCS